MLFRLTENVFIQDIQCPHLQQVQWTVLRDSPAANPDVLSHVIHFYRGREIDRHTHERTVKSVLEARRCAIPTVHLHSVVMQEEQDLAFEGFSQARPIVRGISDLAKFAIPRRLPLLFDIIDAGIEVSDPKGFIVLTNSDICLNAGFYNSVSALLRYGVDCLVINRLTVGELDQYDQIPEMGGMEVGSRHLGFDCFVFPVSWASSFAKVASCVGMTGVMRPLLYNLVARANRLVMMKQACLTYHYGDEKSWDADKYKDYKLYNWSLMAESLKMLSRDGTALKRLNAFCTAYREMYVPALPT